MVKTIIFCFFYLTFLSTLSKEMLFFYKFVQILKIQDGAVGSLVSALQPFPNNRFGL
jgi:hypothetical protein